MTRWQAWSHLFFYLFRNCVFALVMGIIYFNNYEFTWYFILFPVARPQNMKCKDNCQRYIIYLKNYCAFYHLLFVVF